MKLTDQQRNQLQSLLAGRKFSVCERMITRGVKSEWRFTDDQQEVLRKIANAPDTVCFHGKL